MATRPYLPRSADVVLQELVKDHSAVLVVGPRATGKTTSCEQLAKSVVRLGDPRAAAAFEVDPQSILEGLSAPILIDEWQEVPSSLQAIKLAVDSNADRGQFLVTGSVRGEIDAPTWPGTGRLVRLSMYGLTEREKQERVRGTSWLEALLTTGIPASHRSDDDVRDYIRRALQSGFPEPALMESERSRNRWLASYVDQLVTRDASMVAPGRDPHNVCAHTLVP
jgi:uncharacterized protein